MRCAQGQIVLRGEFEVADEQDEDDAVRKARLQAIGTAVTSLIEGEAVRRASVDRSGRAEVEATDT